MKTRPFGPTKDSLPTIGLGSWNLEHTSRNATITALRRGFELGMTHVDTAEMYGSGAVEEIVGEALNGWRDEVFVVTKVLPSNASRRGTLEACERSLRRLRIERVDLYLLHWPGQHPLEDTIGAFEELVAAGKTRHYGVSNFDAEELEAAVRIAGPGKIACNQVLYHLEERAIEHRVIPACERSGVATVAYSPFGSGSFPDNGSPGYGVLARIARTHSATPRQVALAFLTRRESVFAIPKSARVEHVEENAVAGELTLSDAEVRTIDAAFPRGREPRGLPMI